MKVIELMKNRAGCCLEKGKRLKLLSVLAIQGIIESMKEKIVRDYTTVETLLKSMNVTAEERELYKGLIKECLENEQKIAECSASTKKNIERISTILEGVYKSMVAMEAALEDLIQEAEDLSLRMLPSDKFYYE